MRRELVEEGVVHVPRRPEALVFAVDERPPLPQLLLLGLQYAALVSIYLVVVVVIVRHAGISGEVATDIVSLSLVAAAVATLLQALRRGPVGSGFLAPPVFSAIYLAPSLAAAAKGGLPLVLGMTVTAALVEIGLGLALRRLRILIQPVLSGLTVLLVGLDLGIVGMGEFLDVQAVASAGFRLDLVVTFLTLGSCVALSVWGSVSLRMFCTLVGLGVGVTAAIAVGMIGWQAWAAIAAQPALRLPGLGHIAFAFDIELLPPFLAAALAATLRTIGVVTTCQRINDAAWQRPDLPNIRKGIFADGLGCLLGAGLGAPGMNIGPSLVGISSMTGVTSRTVAYACAGFLLVAAVFPQVAQAFLSLPPQVAGALLVFTSAFMIAGGMQIVTSKPPDSRAIYVIAIATLLALSKHVFPTYYENLAPLARTLAGSSLALGLGSAVLLTLLFRLGTRRAGGWTYPDLPSALAAAADAVAGTVRGWKVAEDNVAGAEAGTRGVLRHLDEAALCDGPVEVRAAWDGLDLAVTIAYAGGLVASRHLPTRLRVLPPDRLDDEEAAAHVGLLNFLRTLHADRRSVVREGDRVVIELRYAA